MSGVMTTQASGVRGLKRLIGSGDRIGGFVLPFVVVGIALNVWRPALFSLGGPGEGLRLVSWAVLATGIVGWAWSVMLILTRVPRGELITTGPYSLVKHPLYTDIAFLVLPWAGFLLDSWLGVVLGVALYVASRRYAPAEEQTLALEFGAEWDEYRDGVALPWL